MGEYDFTLKFFIPSGGDPEAYLERLYESGCDDAVIGVGMKGRIALDFLREADSAYEAVSTAIAAVKSVIPAASLIEVTPDIVGLTDAANILGCSRQNMRQMMVSYVSTFPLPIHEGNPSFWHLANLLRWFKEKGNYPIEDRLIDLADTNMQFNLAKEMRNLEANDRLQNLRALVA